MRKVSKVLAVVLALTMLVATSVLPASAVDLENASLKLSFKDVSGNTITSAAAGSMVDVFVSLKVDAFVQQMQFYVNYNSDYVSHNRYNTESVSAANTRYAAQWLGNFGDDSEFEITEESEYYEFDQANGAFGYCLNWGADTTLAVTPYNASTMPTPPLATTKLIKVVYATNSGDRTLLVNTKGEYYEMLKIRFAVNKDIEKIDDSIFFFDNQLEKVVINIDSENVPFADCAVNSVKQLNVTFEHEGQSAPAQDPITVENIATQVQWQDKDAGKMRVAFRGNIKNYDLNLVDGSQTEIADISAMGVVYSKSNADPTVGGANCSNAPAWTIYDFTTGGYFFRAVVGNYGYDDTTTLNAKAYIVIDGQTIYAPSAMTTTGAQAYAAGVANGMSAK
jgi:hypothetical protein